MIVHGHPRRIVKVADDVIRLIQANRLDVNDTDPDPDSEKCEVEFIL
jgi:hypothetical protein